MSPKQNVTINPCAGGFAVFDADGNVIRDGFNSRALACMWASRQGLYQGKRAAKRKTEIEIPDTLADERIFPLPFYASLQSRNYKSFFPEARRGEWGTLIQMTSRTFGIRIGDYRRSVAAREVKTTTA